MVSFITKQNFNLLNKIIVYSTLSEGVLFLNKQCLLQYVIYITQYVAHHVSDPLVRWTRTEPTLIRCNSSPPSLPGTGYSNSMHPAQRIVPHSLQATYAVGAPFKLLPHSDAIPTHSHPSVPAFVLGKEGLVCIYFMGYQYSSLLI